LLIGVGCIRPVGGGGGGDGRHGHGHGHFFMVGKVRKSQVNASTSNVITPHLPVKLLKPYYIDHLNSS
jgi:hypothetical protein